MTISRLSYNISKILAHRKGFLKIKIDSANIRYEICNIRFQGYSNNIYNKIAVFIDRKRFNSFSQSALFSPFRVVLQAH